MTKIFNKAYYESQLNKPRIENDTQKTWSHYCPEEKTWLSNLQGEPCNWCDTQETEANRD